MADKYYILNLWDYGTPAFVSFDKMYIGTEAEIRTALQAMKEAEKGSDETVAAIERYLAGDKTATHNIAYNEIPVLEPCTRIASSTLSLGEYSWEHTNVWGFPYVMKCDSAEVKQLIVKYKRKYYRCVLHPVCRLHRRGKRGRGRSRPSSSICLIPIRNRGS